MVSRMVLTRDALVSDQARRQRSKGSLAKHLLSDQQLDDSLNQTLSHWDGKSDVWVFGYGSLIWNPQLKFKRSNLAKVFGYHRRLCLWSRINRGTPERPGLVLGLEPGGSCQGMAFCVGAREVRQEFELLWRREMLMGSYFPRWVNAHFASSASAQALTFVVDRTCSGYTGRLPDTKILKALRTASGCYGTSADYACNTLAALKAQGIHDPQLTRLCNQLNGGANG